MISLGLSFLAVLLISEYGFRFRRSAIASLSGPWDWRLTVIRLALWGAVWFFVPVPCIELNRFLCFLGSGALGEAAAWLVRREIQRY